MNRQILKLATHCSVALAIAASCSSAFAEHWVEYYRTGTSKSHKAGTPVNWADVVWDLNEVDIDSIRREGKFLRYRVRIKSAEAGPTGIAEMQAECAGSTRGQLPDPVMRSTYKETLGGEEVRFVCAAAEKLK
jgi:hypothetical protein